MRATWFLILAQIILPMYHKNTGAYYRSLTLDHTQAGTADTSNYPLVFLGNASLKTTANGGRVTSASGFDIIFCTSPGSHSACLGSLLPFERVSWSATTGLGEFWVKVPTLSHSADTVIYVYYGDPTITTDQQNVTGTWSAAYSAVYHFPTGSTITTSNVTDSTTNANLMNNKNGSPTLVAGQIGQAYSGNTTTDTIFRNVSATYPTGAGPVSVSAWFKLASAPSSAPGGAAAPIGIGGNNTLGRFTIFLENALIGGNFSTQVTDGAWSWDTNWHFAALVYPSGASSVANVIIYLDASVITITSAGAGALNVSGNSAIQIGADPNASTTFNFPGLIDEVRVSNGITASNVTADFNSQKTGSTFITVGSEVHI